MGKATTCCSPLSLSQSSGVKSLFLQEGNTLFVNRPVKQMTWIVRRALNAMSDRNKTET